MWAPESPDQVHCGMAAWLMSAAAGEYCSCSSAVQ